MREAGDPGAGAGVAVRPGVGERVVVRVGGAGGVEGARHRGAGRGERGDRCAVGRRDAGVDPGADHHGEQLGVASREAGGGDAARGGAGGHGGTGVGEERADLAAEPVAAAVGAAGAVGGCGPRRVGRGLLAPGVDQPGPGLGHGNVRGGVRGGGGGPGGAGRCSDRGGAGRAAVRRDAHRGLDECARGDRDVGVRVGGGRLLGPGAAAGGRRRPCSPAGSSRRGCRACR